MGAFVGQWVAVFPPRVVRFHELPESAHRHLELVQMVRRERGFVLWQFVVCAGHAARAPIGTIGALLGAAPPEEAALQGDASAAAD